MSKGPGIAFSAAAFEALANITGLVASVMKMDEEQSGRFFQEAFDGTLQSVLGNRSKDAVITWSDFRLFTKGVFEKLVVALDQEVP